MAAAERQECLDQKIIHEQLCRMARQAAALTAMASMPDVEVIQRDLEPGADLSFDHWVMVLMLNGAAFKVTFSARFTSKVARQMAARHLGVSAESIEPGIAHDSMGEFCNQAVGFIKRVFVSASEDLSSSAMTTPVAQPSFDVGGQQVSALGPISDSWRVCFLGNEFVCNVTLDVHDWSVVGKLRDADLSVLTVHDSGDVEFF